jgi:hypothetical protein
MSPTNAIFFGIDPTIGRRPVGGLMPKVGVPREAGAVTSPSAHGCLNARPRSP